MIVVTGLIEFADGDADAVKTAAADAVAATRQEEGCISYSFYQDIEKPGVFRVYEEWESDAHLAAHAKAEHMRAFGKALAATTLVSRNLIKYERSNMVTL